MQIAHKIIKRRTWTLKTHLDGDFRTVVLSYAVFQCEIKTEAHLSETKIEHKAVKVV